MQPRKYYNTTSKNQIPSNQPPSDPEKILKQLVIYTKKAGRISKMNIGTTPKRKSPAV